MADQQNRGGKKQGAAQPQPQQQQGVGGAKPRPPEGQPGGPKEKGKSGRDSK